MQQALPVLYPVKVKGACKEYENTQQENIKRRWKEKGSNALKDRKREDDLDTDKLYLFQPRLERVNVELFPHLMPPLLFVTASYEKTKLVCMAQSCIKREKNGKDD